MKFQEEIEFEACEDTADCKNLRISLGEVRCPKCHKHGTLVIYLVAEKTIDITARIIHERKTKDLKACILQGNLDITEDIPIVQFMPQIAMTIDNP